MNSRVLLLAVLLLSSSLVFCQRPGSTGASGGIQPTGPTFSQGATVQVRVSWPNERPVEDEIVHVQLMSELNVPVMETYASRDGMASFRSVLPGRYRLKLDGPDITDVTSEFFDIGAQDRMHMEWVHVSPKTTAANQNAGGAPMVSASELNIPPKAHKAYEQAMEAFAKGDMKKAEAKFNRALEIYPKYARAWSNLGVLYMRMNDESSARDAFLKAVAADDKYPYGYLNLARLSMKHQNTKEASEYLAKALACDPGNPETRALLANEELLTGQYDKALADARLVRRSPNDNLADVHLIAADALAHMNKSDEAVKEYELYLKEDPHSAKAAQVRAAMAQLQAKRN